MGWYYDYKPYVSVAQRRRQALRELEKRRKKGLPVSPIEVEGRTIARTFWGKAWCDNLESYSDYENRLPRGRTYVRNGSVVHLEIKPGKISAIVSGSELYDVEISIAPLPDSTWKRVKKECAGQIGSLVELLQGKLSKSVMDVVTRHNEGLFPKPAEIKMSCSCPDWAGMCKHIAAVMYGVGARLDTNPDLLFVLRKVDHLELIADAVDAAPAPEKGRPRGKKTIEAGVLADVFGIEMTEPEVSTVATATPTKNTRSARASSAKAARKNAPTQAAAKSTKASAAKPAEAKAKVKLAKTATAKSSMTKAAKSSKPNAKAASGKRVKAGKS